MEGFVCVCVHRVVVLEVDEGEKGGGKGVRYLCSVLIRIKRE